MATEAIATRTLNVELISAAGLKDTELIGKSDPYVVLSIGKTERKSKVAKDQPSTPAWNEEFTIPVLDTDTDLLVVIKNDDTLGRDEEMGRVVVPLSSIYGGSHSASTFPLELKGKPHGEIVLSLSFAGEGHGAHHTSEAHGLSEKVEGLALADQPEHHEGEGGHPAEGHHHGGLLAGLKEKRRKKKERKQRGSGDEGGSSSSSDSDKGE